MKKKINVLIVGSGGREDAMGWKISKSPLVKQIFFAPGNGGTGRWGSNVPIKADDINGLLEFALEKKIGLTVVGPEDPLILGIVDLFQDAGLKIFGPSAEAAKIEANKARAKNLMSENNIPTAGYAVYHDYDAATDYLKKRGAPVVIKANGQALGKGARVCRNMAKAQAALHDIMVKKMYGDAGKSVVLEDLLLGNEISLHAICDGDNAALLLPSRDHKRALNRDRGDNTGGMGALAPVPGITARQMKVFAQTIVNPALEGMKQNGSPYSGLLYPGLMLTEDGPKVLEFNCRFGDPETQPLMRLLKTDLVEIMLASIEGRIGELKLQWHKGFAVCVVMASGGYPGKYEKGKVIKGLLDATEIPDVTVFHAGTIWNSFRCVTNGGRVLGVTATGKTLAEAIKQAYKGVKCIKFEGMHYRTDIGKNSLPK